MADGGSLASDSGSFMDEATRARSEAIRATVQDLKLGRITRAEMLLRLHSLRTAGPASMRSGSSPSSAVTAAVGLAASEPSSDPAGTHTADLGPYVDAAAPLGVVSGFRAPETLEGRPEQPPPPPPDEIGDGVRSYGAFSAGSYPSTRGSVSCGGGEDLAHDGGFSEGYSDASSEGVTESPAGHDRRGQREPPLSAPPQLARHERVRAEVMRECTFRPRVRPLPASYGKHLTSSGFSVPFHERAARWQAQAERRKTSARRGAEHQEVEGCTFRPRIDERSGRIASQMRSSWDAGSYHASDAEAAASAQRVSARLYQQSFVAEKRRRDREAEKRRKEEEVHQRTCSFQPRTTRGLLYVGASPTKAQSLGDTFQSNEPVHERLSRPKENVYKKAATVQDMFAECTFEPSTNRVPTTMENAREYLKVGVVERLTCVPPPPPPESPSADAAKLLQTPGPEASGHRARDEVADVDEWGEAMVKGEEAEVSQENRTASFQAFLKRQGAQGSRRRALEEKQRAEAEKHANATFVAPGSKRILEQHRVSNTPFLQRMQTEMHRRQQTLDRKFAQSAERETMDCTFRPHILKRSQDRPARPVAQLSTAEAERRDNALRSAKLRREAKEARELRFQPQLSTRVAPRGRLNVLTDPEDYVARQREWDRQREEVRCVRKQEEERELLAECSFTPATKALPGYIQRMASAHRDASLLRAFEDMGEREKPDWR